MKLLITTTTYPRWEKDSTPGFIADLAYRLSERDNKVRVLAPHYSKAKYSESRGPLSIRRYGYWLPRSGQSVVYNGGGLANQNNGFLYKLKLISLIGLQSLWVLYYVLLKKTQVINAHWIIPQGFIAIMIKKITRVPVAVSIHGSDVFDLNSPKMLKVKKFVLKNSDIVFVNSQATYEAAKNIYPEREYIKCSMGVDIDHFKPKKSKKNKNNHLNIVFVGRLVEVKGILHICEAVKVLKKIHKQPVHLRIVGEGPLRKSIEEFIRQNDLEKNIELLGWIDHNNLAKIYNTSDIYVGASYTTETGAQEAFGLTIAEAQACGLPVVSTNVGGVSDIVIDGKTGYLAKEKSSEDLANKINKLIKNPKTYSKMSNQARKRVVQRFSWGAVTKVYKDELNKLI